MLTNIIYLGISIAVIGLIYLYLKRLGLRGDVSIDRGEARRLLSLHEPDAVVEEMLEADGSVLMRLQGGGFAVARGFGHMPTVHILSKESISSVVDDEKGVTLKIKDYAMPRLDIRGVSAQTVTAFLGE